MAFVVLLGRVLFSFLFLLTPIHHFAPQAVGYAAQHGVPAAGLLVPLSGIVAGIGGVSILLGYHARIGAWLIVLFLAPVTVVMHNFWAVSDPMTAAMQESMFLKNLSMLGAALLIAYFGPGPLSLDERRNKGQH